MRGLSIALGLCGLLPHVAFGFQEESVHVRAVRTENPPEIDGRIVEDAWQQAGRIEGLRQKIPVAYGEASQRTEVWVLYDADFLYIAVRAHESDPRDIIASKMVRDGDMASDDRITISLDTFLDRRNGYQFEINPLGNKRDGLIENSDESYEWDGIWYADARVDAQGWAVEVAIPFQTLSVADDRTTWGMQIVRYTKRNGEEDRWASPTPEIEAFNMNGNGHLEGLVGIRQGIGLDVVPKLALRHTDDGQTGKKDTDFDPGVDAFYRITPSLTGALTVNTDFGEAEVDERQINLTRSSLFFPEKRQFFLQDAGIFDFGGLQRNPLPYFSRRIGLSNQGEEIPILVGTKVTGRVGPLNVGFVDVVTDKYQRLPDADGRREKIGVKNLAVARASVNVLEESTAGLIFTHGDPNSDDENWVLGADANYRKSDFLGNRTVVGRLWAQHSHTSGVDSDDWAWGTRLVYPNDRVYWYVIAEGIQENFNPALGFRSRNGGTRNYYTSYRFRHRPERFVRTLDHRVTTSLVTDSHDDFESAEITFDPVDLANAAGDTFKVTYARVFEDHDDPFALRSDVAIEPGRYSWNRWSVEMASSDGRPVSVGLIVSASGFYEGDRFDVEPSVAWRPSKHLVFTAAYDRRDVDLDFGDFVVHIASFRVDIQFNPEVSWNTFAQYDSDSDSIGVNTRLRWIIEPGREFFLVLNQGVVIDDGDWERGETEPRAKLGWTFRF
ncbi:MAG: DUF5916 domain-containing protein [Myxococcota bacterium]|jgi:hypothetical protein|nr:DUF5916 domain-containing protein [Myxococcota bacterium]